MRERLNQNLLIYFRYLVVICVVFIAAIGQAQAEQRIVAIGDLHGDLDNAQSILKLVGLIDDKGQWAGGDAILIQTGDMVDRGAESKGVMDLFRRLGKQAKSAGGQVINLLGNHELMNLQGDWRYVSKGDLEVFGGRTARMRAFSKEGEYGQWLASLQTVAQVDDAIFLHGGLLPHYAQSGLQALNTSISCQLSGGNNQACGLQEGVLGRDGPFWYRGYVLGDETSECPKLEATLKHLNAKRMVVGHTTRRNGRIQFRCNGKLAVIDIGIADGYGGNLGAWEWRDGNAYAIYPGETVKVE
ncbi:MAG: metallophosphatase [Gammaproteobacteria bacterium]|nr:MAG: metallophosphatase [Gammaproteobacteria bacterium]